MLLIAACVLMMQVFIDQHPELFETGAERADVRLFLLCVILGVTGWASLCRLLRAETLKLRELEYVQAAQAFGVGRLRIMGRHILPNVMHLVLITTVLDFSALVLYEAVLSYVGVGRRPLDEQLRRDDQPGAQRDEPRPGGVGGRSSAAFAFMVVFVLAANLFADGVRDAFDPRARRFRPKRPAARGRLHDGLNPGPHHADARPPEGHDRLRCRPGARDRWPAPVDRARRDLRAGGRVRLRQEHDRAGADAPAAGCRPGGRRQRAARTPPSCSSCPNPRCAACAAGASA